MAIGISGKAMVLRSFFFYFWYHTCILNMLLLVLWNIEFCVSQVFNRYQAHFLCVCVFFLFSGRYRFVIHVSELMPVLMLSWCCVAYSFRLTYSLPTHTPTHTNIDMLKREYGCVEWGRWSQGTKYHFMEDMQYFVWRTFEIEDV